MKEEDIKEMTRKLKMGEGKEKLGIGFKINRTGKKSSNIKDQPATSLLMNIINSKLYRTGVECYSVGINAKQGGRVIFCNNQQALKTKYKSNDIFFYYRSHVLKYSILSKIYNKRPKFELFWEVILLALKILDR